MQERENKFAGQVMMEFCDPDNFQIILATGEDKYELFTLKELLPMGFGPANLNTRKPETE